MFKAPSSIRAYAEFWSEDPAFEQRPTEGDAADYDAKLTAALDTGDWSALRVDGAGEPTAFTVRVLSADQLGRISDLRNDGAGDNEFLTLVFRLALQSIAPFEGPKLEHETDDELGKMVSTKWMESVLVGAPGLRLIREIGLRVWSKSVSLSPK